MKLQLGKRYRTRDGQETTPLENNDDPLYPFKAKVNDFIYTWTEKGSFPVLKSHHPLDLVEEIEEIEEKEYIAKVTVEWNGKEQKITINSNDRDKAAETLISVPNLKSFVTNFSLTDEELCSVTMPDEEKPSNRPKTTSTLKEWSKALKLLKSEESQEPRIDYDKQEKDLANIATVSGRPIQYDADLYDLETKENGTIILTPKKKRKVWIEVYDWVGNIMVAVHTSKEALNQSIDYETLLEVIEREY